MGRIASAETRPTATAETLIGGPLADDCVNPDTGEMERVVMVTDNGPAMQSIAVAHSFHQRPHLRHVRTRPRAPETNAVIERWFQALRYERLYRFDIDTGDDLAAHVEAYIDEYNRVRPHETITWQRPLDRHLQNPEPSNRPGPDSEQER